MAGEDRARGGRTSDPVLAAKVVFVHAQAGQRTELCRLLTEAGCECLPTVDLAAAREFLDADDDIAVMIAVLASDDQQSADLIRIMAADFPTLAVVVAAAADDGALRELAIQIGAYGYLAKPITSNGLIVTILGAVRRRALEKTRRIQYQAVEGGGARFKTLHNLLVAIEQGKSVTSTINGAEIIARLSHVISHRNEETLQHIERMSRTAALLAEAVGLSNRTSKDIRLATALHDVGKIGVPESTLLKSGSLSTDETAAVQRHTEIGYELLAGSSCQLLNLAARIALDHHEHWDGGGYPRGLQGQEILVEGRIAAIADVFDALTSERMYRPALAIDAAVGIMTRARGTQFEPRLFDAFVAHLDDVIALRAAYPDGADGADEPPLPVLVIDDHEGVPRGPGADLGARQVQVLQLVAAGMANKMIAAELHLSLNTVRNHVQNILYKLNAHSKLEAVATAVREGIIEPVQKLSA